MGNNAEDTIAFMISRIPHRTTAPVTAEIGAPDDAVADASFSFWSIDNIDETLFDTNPCLCIGSFKMVMSASDDWTVQTITNADGIGLFNDNVTFVFPTGVNQASSGTHILPNSGTAPVFTTNIYTYQISKQGFCSCWIELDGDGGADGAGSVNTLLSCPLTIGSMATAGNACIGTGRMDGASSPVLSVNFQGNDGIDNIILLQNSAAPQTNIDNDFFTAGARYIIGTVKYFIQEE